jgi:hypothetical protein
MEPDDPKSVLRHLLPEGIFKGVRLGPGLLGNIAYVAIALFICIGMMGWALSNHPYVALAVIFLTLGFAFYLIERVTRFAEKNPAAALMGGTEFFHYLRDQAAAKNPGIVIDAAPIGAGRPPEDGNSRA